MCHTGIHGPPGVQDFQKFVDPGPYKSWSRPELVLGFFNLSGPGPAWSRIYQFFRSSSGSGPIDFGPWILHLKHTFEQYLLWHLYLWLSVFSFLFGDSTKFQIRFRPSYGMGAKRRMSLHHADVHFERLYKHSTTKRRLQSLGCADRFWTTETRYKAVPIG